MLAECTNAWYVDVTLVGFMVVTGIALLMIASTMVYVMVFRG